MPLIFTNPFKTEETVANEIEKFDYGKYSSINLLHRDTGEVEQIDLDTYLYGVVASEMPATFELEALKAQANTITGQVENISLACQTEKQVLEEKITVRNVIISFLLVLFVLIGYIKVRRKLLC